MICISRAGGFVRGRVRWSDGVAKNPTSSDDGDFQRKSTCGDRVAAKSRRSREEPDLERPATRRGATRFTVFRLLIRPGPVPVNAPHVPLRRYRRRSRVIPWRDGIPLNKTGAGAGMLRTPGTGLRRTGRIIYMGSVQLPVTVGSSRASDVKGGNNLDTAGFIIGLLLVSLGIVLSYLLEKRARGRSQES